MTNTVSGAVGFLANGEQFTMKLTLGALAEIENALNVKSLSDVGTLLKQFGSSDVASVAAALLRAGGHTVTANDVLALPVDLGTVIGAIGDAFSVASGKTSVPLAGSAVSNSGSAS